jgi:tagaturonate reductase
MIVTGEPFALWVIEGKKPQDIAKVFPLDKAGLPVIFTDNLQPYRERKVRILNGAHTSSVLAAYLTGLNTVEEMMKDKLMRSFLERAIYNELAPMVPLPQDEVRAFAGSVMERFVNPFIRHNLLSISLNSVSKFKTRVLPTILETQGKENKLPEALCFSLAALIAFYQGEMVEGKFIGIRSGETYEVMDDAAVLGFFAANKHLPATEFTGMFLARIDFWGQDLTQVQGLITAVAGSLEEIKEKGMRGAVEALLMRLA